MNGWTVVTFPERYFKKLTFLDNVTNQNSPLLLFVTFLKCGQCQSGGALNSYCAEEAEKKENKYSYQDDLEEEGPSLWGLVSGVFPLDLILKADGCGTQVRGRGWRLQTDGVLTRWPSKPASGCIYCWRITNMGTRTECLTWVIPSGSF